MGDDFTDDERAFAEERMRELGYSPLRIASDRIVFCQGVRAEQERRAADGGSDDSR